MGNISAGSCTCKDVSVGNVLKKKGKAMLLYSSGSTREIKLPAKCGELMIQEFGHVITPVDELRRTGRVSALLADEELEAGKVYLLLPVKRVHCKASKIEMGIAEKHSGQTRGNKMPKVSPTLISRSSKQLGDNEVTLFPIIKGNPPRWNPVLDPISESPSPLNEFASQFSSHTLACLQF